MTNLNDIDQKLRKLYPVAMSKHSVDIQVTIEKILGFELFGSYETWADGWQVSGYANPDDEQLIVASRKNLDEAVDRFIELIEARRKSLRTGE